MWALVDPSFVPPLAAHVAVALVVALLPTAVEWAWRTRSRRDRSCPVCLEAARDAATARALPCGHVGHAACLHEWRRRCGSACARCGRA